MRRLIFVTQLIDPTDPVLGFACALVEALRDQADDVVVIANEVRGDLPGVTVHSLGRERGAGKVMRGLAYGRALVRSLPADALLVHMCPEYLALAAPLPARKLLWYAHPAVTLPLRAGLLAADAILTSLPGAFPIETDKLHVIGQATDVERYGRVPPPEPGPSLRVLAMGRTSPAKGLRTIAQGVQLARQRGLNVELRIVGPSTTADERAHRTELAIDGVCVEEAVPADSVGQLLTWCDVLVNNMVAGSGDKVVFEALAARRLAIASNPSLRDVLGGLDPALDFRRSDPNTLASRLQAVGVLSRERRLALGVQLRQRVVDGHSLQHWASKVAAIASQGCT